MVNDQVSCLYAPQFLTSDQENHNHIFIGMVSGNVHIYDIPKREFTSFTIRCLKMKDAMSQVRNQFKVSDIKCQPEKMNRLLIAHEKSEIVVFSLNK